MIETEFDSEVMSLIDDLGLVLKVSEEGKRWWSAWLASQYTRFPLCERYKAYQSQKRLDQERRLRLMCKEQYSYYRGSVHGDPGSQLKLDF